MSETLKVVSYNLRMWQDDWDGVNSFKHRIGMVFEKIQKEQPDIIGFQEVLPEMHVFLERLLLEYQLVGQFREANFLGEGTFIAVKKDTLQVLEYNTFWLSPMPYVPGSRFQQQSDCPRICNVVRLRCRRTNRIFRVYNLHLDHVGEEARVKGMQCILDDLSARNKMEYLPCLILGDFNAEPDSAAIRLCKLYREAPLTDLTWNFPVTYHGYGETQGVKIDYIFGTREFFGCLKSVKLWKDSHCGIYLSDHYPVCAEFNF